MWILVYQVSVRFESQDRPPDLNQRNPLRPDYSHRLSEQKPVSETSRQLRIFRVRSGTRLTGRLADYQRAPDGRGRS